MAVVLTKNPTGLKLRFDCGKDDNNKTIIRSKTYSNVKPGATDQDIFDVGTALVSLQSNTLQEMARIDNSTLSE